MQNDYKRKFGFVDLYDSIVRGIRALPHLIVNQVNSRVNHSLIERLMLATTEVNGCEICSYAHAHMALKQGFSQEEINALLGGSDAFIKEDESTAILFAQHYADSKARPDKEAYLLLQTTYGKKEANIMVRAIQVMMMGNLLGIPISAFLARLKGKPYKNSSFFYEIGMLLIQPILFPFAFIDALIRSITRRPSIRLSNSSLKND